MPLRAERQAAFAADPFEPIYACSPWPVLMLGADGAVIGASDDRCHPVCEGGALDTPLRRLARLHYLEALRGAGALRWVREVDVVRALPSGERVHERLYPRAVPWGTSVVIVDRSEAHCPQASDIQTARLAALGFMVAGVCHELTNPLTSLHSIVQILRAEPAPTPELLDKGLGNIARNVGRILDIARRLVQFSRVGDAPRMRLAVDEAVDEALYVLRQDGRLRAIEVRHDDDREAQVVGDIGQLREVFLNLFVNAVQAMEGAGRLAVATRRAGGCVVVRVQDSGPGIGAHDAEKLFEPFFTTKGGDRGTGLGLPISREIAQEHGGTLEFRPAEGPGAVLVLTLPEAAR